jgi:hypothetical protein
MLCINRLRLLVLALSVILSQPTLAAPVGPQANSARAESALSITMTSAGKTKPSQGFSTDRVAAVSQRRVALSTSGATVFRTRA